MKKPILYLDILGFRELVETNSDKIPTIFSIVNTLKANKHPDFKVIMFSDTVIIFNEIENKPIDYYCTYLIEFVVELYYKLLHHNIFFRAIIHYDIFNYKKLANIEAYYGKALINCYDAEKEIKCIGLFIDKNISKEVFTFDISQYNDNYYIVHIWASIKRLYNYSAGILPVQVNTSETDDFSRADEDLCFLRKIYYYKENHKSEAVRTKYQNTYIEMKRAMPLFFEVFEKVDFLPMTLNSDYIGDFNPFDEIE